MAERNVALPSIMWLKFLDKLHNRKTSHECLPMLPSRDDVKSWMTLRAQKFVNGRGAFNRNAMVEAVAQRFGLYENQFDYVIPAWVFDLALEVETGLSGHGSAQAPPGA